MWSVLAWALVFVAAAIGVALGIHVVELVVGPDNTSGLLDVLVALFGLAGVGALGGVGARHLTRSRE